MRKRYFDTNSSFSSPFHFFLLSFYFFSNFLLLILAPTSVPPENYFSFSAHNVWAISNVLVLNKLFQLEWP